MLLNGQSRPKVRKSPWDEANLFSRYMLYFMWPLIWRGEQAIGLEDQQEPPRGVKAKYLARRLEKNYNIELTTRKRPNFFRSIVKTFGTELALVGLFDLIAKCFWQPLQIISLGWLIRDTGDYLKVLTDTNDDNLMTTAAESTTIDNMIESNVTQATPTTIALDLLQDVTKFAPEIDAATRVAAVAAAPAQTIDQIYTNIMVHTAVLVLSTWMVNLFFNPYILQAYYVGLKCRIATTALVYQKATRLNQASLNIATTGRLTNMLSNDVNRFDNFCSAVLNLIIAPLQAVVILIILDRLYVGLLPTLACLATIFAFILIQTALGRGFGKFRLLTARRTDERIRIINELIVGIRIIKMYAWEEPFKLLVERARRREINMIAITSTLRALNSTLFFISNKVTVFAALITYILLGNEVDAEKVFVTISLCSAIRIPLTLFFPSAIAYTAETIVSCDRINNFLCLAEHQRVSIGYKQTNDKLGYKYALAFEKVRASWTDLSSSASSLADSNVGAIFEDLTFRLRPGELLLVVGRVAAGKSSLLMGILGELPILSGQLQVIGKLSYCPQEAWIFPGTVRENIIFGRAFKAERYNSVLAACSLLRDIEIFPYGDKTIVGERGISLSGGQKARVNLARCLYHEADIYLLDDPLSAVDAPVARDIFREAIQGFLKGKSVILATHQLQFLRQASRLLVLDRKHAPNFGTVEQVYQSDAFKAFGFAEDAFADANQAGGGSPTPLALTQSIGQLSGSSEISRSQEKMEQFHQQHQIKLSKTSLHQATTSNCSSAGSQLDASGFVEEERQTGSENLIDISGNWSSYKYYINSGFNTLGILWFILINIMAQFTFQYTDIFLSFWTDAAQRKSLDGGINFVPIRYTDNLPDNDLIIIFTILVFLAFLTNFLRAVSLYVGTMIASIFIHKSFFASIVNAPIKFFDFNPIGILLNRLGRDIGFIDETMPQTYYDVFATMVNVFGLMILSVYVDPWNIIASLLLIAMSLAVRAKLSKIIIRLKRLEGIRGAPVFTHLSVTLNGLTTIRAFRSNEQFLQKFDYLLDSMSAVSFLYITGARLLSFTVDIFSLAFVTAVTITTVILSLGSTTPSAIGLIISQIIFLPGPIQWGMRQMVEVESQMTCVQRVKEYSNIEPEETDEERDRLLMQSCQLFAPKQTRGHIQYKNLSLRYFPDEPYVLHNLNITINEGEKVGIVGRTGAGKSSIIGTLFRLYPFEGSIEIDGVDTMQMSLRQLRSSISIIPQDPVLFAGTLRKNLDPFSEHSDEELWSALQAVQLRPYFEATSLKLKHQIQDGGSNLSVGQRQLICLARAIIGRNNILVLDEATANVDPETDAFIQETIQAQFAHCTVITIAHRLITIADSDRVLVLDQGQVKEFDEPHNLLQNENGIFRKMVQSSQVQQMERLKKIIEDSHRTRVSRAN